MKGKLLAWLLLMILSSFALTNSSFHLEHHQRDVNLSRPILRGQETIHGVLGTVRLNGSEKDYERSNKEQEDLVVLEKGKKGKTGVYGGATATHRPGQEKSSATPASCLTANTMLPVIFNLHFRAFHMSVYLDGLGG
ncbi:uncharacterized protein LOC112187368 [Rosa chinensis]|uniref:uncharacterized protein LOC112187368 n=1 Tax=Rosa chinensis TaxID=74649 RepID=UPI001AD91D32|nr:uncharacterized protein LOC112187368 [Rosa chinensis]